MREGEYIRMTYTVRVGESRYLEQGKVYEVESIVDEDFEYIRARIYGVEGICILKRLWYINLNTFNDMGINYRLAEYDEIHIGMSVYFRVNGTISKDNIGYVIHKVDRYDIVIETGLSAIKGSLLGSLIERGINIDLDKTYWRCNLNDFYICEEEFIYSEIRCEIGLNK